MTADNQMVNVLYPSLCEKMVRVYYCSPAPAAVAPKKEYQAGIIHSQNAIGINLRAEVEQEHGDATAEPGVSETDDPVFIPWSAIKCITLDECCPLRT